MGHVIGRRDEAADSAVHGPAVESGNHAPGRLAQRDSCREVDAASQVAVGDAGDAGGARTRSMTVRAWRRLTPAEQDAVVAEAESLPLPGLGRRVTIRWKDQPGVTRNPLGGPAGRYPQR